MNAFFHMFADPSNHGVAYEATYDIPLVILSVFISIVSAYTAFFLVERIAHARNTTHRYRWLAAGALTMGIGVWSMHFIAMLAYQLPVTANFDPLITVVSIFPAMLASLVVLYDPHKDSAQRNLSGLMIRGVLMGAGIGLMHYIGMSAMKVNATMHYETLLFMLSIVIAVLLSMLAIDARRWASMQEMDDSTNNKARGAAAVIMGLAITSMHYTGMAAVSFFPLEESLTHEVTNTTDILALSLAAAVLFISIMLLSAIWASRRLEFISQLQDEMNVRKIFQEEIEALERIGRSVLESVDAGIIVVDNQGKVMMFNAAAEAMFSYTGYDMHGVSISKLVKTSLADSVMAILRKTDGFVQNEIHYQESSGIRKEGDMFPVEYSIKTLNDEMRGAVITFKDMTRDKGAESLQVGPPI